MTYRILATLSFAALLALVVPSDPALAACPAGSVQVGERREAKGNIVYVHPVCRRVQVIAPSARGTPFRIANVDEAVNFVVRSPEGVSLAGGTAANSQLTVGTRLVTGPGGRARFSLADGTRLTLGPDTEILLEANASEGTADTPPQPILNVITGLVHWVGQHATAANRRLNKRFVARTYNVFIGVRGTDFEVSVDRRGAGFIRLTSGAIECRDAGGSSPVQMRAGQTLRFSSSGILGLD